MTRKSYSVDCIMANIKLTDDVRAILEKSAITGNLLVLPEGQLDRKFYESVAKVIALAGGKWNRGQKGFVFSSDPREKLGLALETGVIVDTKKERQAFYTPDEIAEELVLMAGVGGLDVLEPSAGDGAIVKQLKRYGANYITCVETEASCATYLSEAGADIIYSEDFLNWKTSSKYDRVVMNPPYNRRTYVKHIERALKWLKPNGALYAIVPDNNCVKLFALGAFTVKKYPCGAFKESGTNIATRIIRIIKEG